MSGTRLTTFRKAFRNWKCRFLASSAANIRITGGRASCSPTPTIARQSEGGDASRNRSIGIPECATKCFRSEPIRCSIPTSRTPELTLM